LTNDLGDEWTCSNNSSYVLCQVDYRSSQIILSDGVVNINFSTLSNTPEVNTSYNWVATTWDTAATNYIDETTTQTTVDVTAPTISLITTKDADGDGKVETATIIFSEPVDDLTFLVGDWTIGGITVNTINTGDTVDDDTFDIVIPDETDGTGAKVVAYVKNAGTDIVGNLMESVSQTSTDGANPVFLSAETKTVNTIDLTFSEDLDGATVNESGNEFAVSEYTISGASETGVGVVTLTLSTDMGTGGTPEVIFTNIDNFKDLAENQAVSPTTKIATDGIAPALTTAVLTSSTTVDLTFSENTTVYTSDEDTLGKITLKGFNPTGISFADNVATLTFTDDLGTAAITADDDDLEIVADTFKDLADNVLDVITNQDVSDGVKPTVVSATASPNPAKDGLVTITVVFSEATNSTAPTFNFTGITGTMTSESDGSWDENTWTETFTLADNNEEKSATIVVSGAIDTANNTMESDSTGTFVVDTVEPTVTVTMGDYALIAGEDSLVTFTFSEDPTGFTVADVITIDSGALSVFAVDGSNVKVYTATLTPTVDTEDNENIITVGTDWTDAAGNAPLAGSDSPNYVVDTVEPTVEVTMDDDALNVGDTALVTFTFSEAPTGFTVADVIVGTGVIGTINTIDPLVQTAIYIPTDDQEVDTNVISVGTAWTDAAGNAPEAGDDSPNYDVDTVEPTVAITYSANPAKAGDITVTVTYSEAIVGTPQISIDQQGSTDVSGVVMSSSDQTIWTYTYTVNTDNASEYVDGTATVSLSTMVDAADNNADGPTNATFEIDTTSPVVAITSPVGSERVNGEKIIIFTDSELTDALCSIDESEWVTCTTNVTTLSEITGFGSLAEDVSLTLYLKDTDTAGNIGTDDVIGIVKDTTVPDAVTIVIDSGEVVTKESTPALALTLTGTTPDYMRFSCDNSVWGDNWVTWDISYNTFDVKTGTGCSGAEGTKTVYVEVKDIAGNIQSIEGSDVIIYDGDNTLTVDDSGGKDFTTIQAAINVATAGDTISVEAGTYVEVVNIDKPLTLSGATAGINKNGYTVPANYAWDDSVESIINHPSPGTGHSAIAIVDIDDVNNVTFEGFVVQELNAVGNVDDSLIRVRAQTQEVSNIVVRNNIIGPFTNTTSQDGTHGRMGLYIVNNPYSDLYGVINSTFSGNKIFDTKGNGNNVFIWSSYSSYGAAGPASMSGTVIEDNEIYGSHRTGVETAGGFSNLTIRNNKIYGNSGLETDDAGDLKYGHGILLVRGSSDASTVPTGFGPKNLTIQGNEIYGNQKSGIYMGPINEDYTIIGNEIYNNGFDGIRLDLEAHFKNPTFEDVDRVGFFGKSENIIANNNNIYGNGGYGVQVIGTPTNGFVLDATSNWWDSASGPTHSSNAGGSGDTISDNVNFRPWYTEQIDEDSVIDDDEPTVIISSTESPLTNASLIPIIIIFDEDVTDLIADEIIVDHGIVSDFSTSDNIVYTANVTPTTDYQGAITVNIAAEVAWDLAGNYNEVATEFSITSDTTAPTNQNDVFASGLTKQGGTEITIVSSSETTNNIWFAPTGTTAFEEGETMTKATNGVATAILSPVIEGDYKLYVIDEAGNISSESSATLTVDNTSPVIAVTSPNGTEVWAGGATKDITWTSTETNKDTVVIEYTVDDGSNWVSIATGETDDGTYSWTVPSIDSATVKIRVTATDDAGNNGNDLSDDNFVIDSTLPTITSKTPVADAIGIDTFADITVVFDEDVVAEASDVTLKKADDTGTVTIASEDISFNSDTNTLTINPSVTLDNNTKYNVALSGITDLAGNVLAGAEWDFTTATSYDISLASGWNLISLPVTPTNWTSVSGVLDSVDGQVESVWTYDAVEGKWYSYSAEGVDINAINSMEAGKGYWLKMGDTAGSLTGSGTLYEQLIPSGNSMEGVSLPQVQLGAGWNMIGYYQLPNTTNATPANALSVLGTSGTSWSINHLMSFTNGTLEAETTISEMIPGKGYWIFMNEAKNYTFGI